MIIESVLIATMAGSNTSVDLATGTIVCKSLAGATEYVTALRHEDSDKLMWLDGQACSRLLVAYNDQPVVEWHSPSLVECEMTNGRRSTRRFALVSAVGGVEGEKPTGAPR